MLLDLTGILHRDPKKRAAKNPHEVLLSQISAWCFESHCWTSPGKDGKQECLWCGKERVAITAVSTNFPICPKNPIIIKAIQVSNGSEVCLELDVNKINALDIFFSGAEPTGTNHTEEG